MSTRSKSTDSNAAIISLIDVLFLPIEWSPDKKTRFAVAFSRRWTSFNVHFFTFSYYDAHYDTSIVRCLSPPSAAVFPVIPAQLLLFGSGSLKKLIGALSTNDEDTSEFRG